jgi:hypothetical protein
MKINKKISYLYHGRGSGGGWGRYKQKIKHNLGAIRGHLQTVINNTAPEREKYKKSVAIAAAGVAGAAGTIYNSTLGAVYKSPSAVRLGIKGLYQSYKLSRASKALKKEAGINLVSKERKLASFENKTKKIQNQLNALLVREQTKLKQLENKGMSTQSKQERYKKLKEKLLKKKEKSIKATDNWAQRQQEKYGIGGKKAIDEQKVKELKELKKEKSNTTNLSRSEIFKLQLKESKRKVEKRQKNAKNTKQKDINQKLSEVEEKRKQMVDIETKAKAVSTLLYSSNEKQKETARTTLGETNLTQAKLKEMSQSLLKNRSELSKEFEKTRREALREEKDFKRETAKTNLQTLSNRVERRQARLHR